MQVESTPLEKKHLEIQIGFKDGGRIEFNHPYVRDIKDVVDYDRQAKFNFEADYTEKDSMQRSYDRCLWDLGNAILRATSYTCRIEVFDDLMAYSGERDWERLEDTLAAGVEPDQVSRIWYVEWSHKRSDGKVWQSDGQWDDDTGNVFYTKLDAFKWLALKAFSGQIWDDKYKLSLK
jgi:hypothetical protein